MATLIMYRYYLLQADTRFQNLDANGLCPIANIVTDPPLQLQRGELLDNCSRSEHLL